MAIADRYLPEFIRQSYSRKLVLLLLIVVLVVSLFGVAIYVQTGAALEDDVKQNLERSTQLQSNSLSEWVQRNEDQVRSLSASNDVNSDDPDTIRNELKAKRATLPESVVAVHYVDFDGFEIRESTDESADGVAYGEHDLRWFVEPPTFDGPADTAVTSPFIDPVSERPAIGVVSPLTEDANRAIVFVIDLETHSETLVEPSPTDGAFTHVVDSEGTVVMSHHTDEITHQNMGPDDEYEVDSMGVMHGLEGMTGYVEMEMGDEEMAMGYAPVEGTDWVIMTHIPSDAAFALQTDVTQSVIGLVIVSMVGLGAIGAGVGRNTSRSLNRLAEKAADLEGGDYDTELETDRTDEIGDLYGAFDSMRDSLRESMAEAGAARKQAEHRQQKLAALARQLEEEASLVMEQAAAGDLTKRMDVDGDDNAMAQVVTEYNGMMDGIEAMVEELKHFATDVAAHSEEVTASVEEVQAASEKVSQSVQEISSHTDQQHETFAEVSTEMEAIAGKTNRIAELSENVSQVAERTADAGTTGRTAAREANEAMSRIDDESEETLEEIEKLQVEIERIEEMAEFITEVASQTNVLALNATIEATRGEKEAGGFTVVADEVKALALETKESAEAIEEVVGSIHEQMDRAAAEVQDTRAEISESMETIDSAGSSLEEIAAYADTTYEGVQEIATASQEQAASTEEVSGMVSEAADLSDRVNHEAQTVAAAAEEQTSSLEDVTRSANDLAGGAESLRTSLERFETDVEQSEHHASDVPVVAGDGSQE